jgi:cytochrome c oxidase subunit 3
MMTSLHASHMTGGIAVMLWLAIELARNTLNGSNPVPLENAGKHWHLADTIWLFLWPLLYLVR